MTGLKIAYVPGVTPGKWLTRWNERYPQNPLQALRYDGEGILQRLGAGDSDLVFVRFATGTSPKTPTIHVIPLYDETQVVCGAKDSDIELYDEPLPYSAIESENFLDLADYPESVGGTAMAMEVCSSGAALLVLPLSVARLHSRKDVVHKELSEVPSTSIGIAWLAPEGDDPTNPVFEEFIGVVRGRGENSSRQASVAQRQQEQAVEARKKRQISQSEAAKNLKKAEAKKKAGARGGTRRGAKPGAKGRKR
ncbi:MAG: LysR substrate-binding domain-containing protein [Paeniglutamicibacter terrestris]|uniref:LysR family transcriptional regulator substrate-binding protein n=1 Tax=Paeniglutamicibacter terrestris TaxID=2723403 RepID=A0ABX1GB08_9MICC|nr:LysR family transcriptional regulator [Arthrobacter sp. 7749]NKG22785.1 LysR family transcriptional regulator substrate-binding protein [Paeniglutamicibacter terrestris]